jgi:flagellar basal body rod protein FlgG
MKKIKMQSHYYYQNIYKKGGTMTRKNQFHVLKAGYLGSKKPCNNCGKCGKDITTEKNNLCVDEDKDKGLLPAGAVPNDKSSMTQEEFDKFQDGMDEKGHLIPFSKSIVNPDKK